MLSWMLFLDNKKIINRNNFSQRHEILGRTEKSRSIFSLFFCGAPRVLAFFLSFSFFKLMQKMYTNVILNPFFRLNQKVKKKTHIVRIHLFEGEYAKTLLN